MPNKGFEELMYIRAAKQWQLRRQWQNMDSGKATVTTTTTTMMMMIFSLISDTTL
jgi:hypothetical protein